MRYKGSESVEVGGKIPLSAFKSKDLELLRGFYWKAGIDFSESRGFYVLSFFATLLMPTTKGGDSLLTDFYALANSSYGGNPLLTDSFRIQRRSKNGITLCGSNLPTDVLIGQLLRTKVASIRTANLSDLEKMFDLGILSGHSGYYFNSAVVAREGEFYSGGDESWTQVLKSQLDSRGINLSRGLVVIPLNGLDLSYNDGKLGLELRKGAKLFRLSDLEKMPHCQRLVKTLNEPDYPVYDGNGEIEGPICHVPKRGLGNIILRGGKDVSDIEVLEEPASLDNGNRFFITPLIYEPED